MGVRWERRRRVRRRAPGGHDVAGVGALGQPIPRDVVAAMAPPDPDLPPHWNVNFRVADADAIAAAAAELGGTVLMAPFSTPGFRNAVLADPQGAAFSISQLVPGPG